MAEARSGGRRWRRLHGFAMQATAIVGASQTVSGALTLEPWWAASGVACLLAWYLLRQIDRNE